MVLDSVNVSGDYKKYVQRAKAITIVSLLLVLVISGFYVLKMVNKETCGIDHAGGVSVSSSLTAGYVLDKEDYFLSKVKTSTKNYVNYDFCYVINVTGQSQSVQVINEFGEILGVGVVDNTTDHYCTKLKQGLLLTTSGDYSVVDNYNYVGLRCPNCNASDQIMIYKELVGWNHAQMSSEGVVTGTRPSYRLEGQKSCLLVIRFIYKLYFWLLFGIWFFVLLFKGFDALEALLFKDMMK